jgi:hypothetical protein
MSTLEWINLAIGTGLFILLAVMAWGVTRHSRD